MVDMGISNMEKKEVKDISDKEIMEIYKKDACKGKEILVEKYSNCIYHLICKKFPTFRHEMKDLYQSGCEGILRAFSCYDASKGKFYNYCRGYILKELSSQTRFFTGESSAYYGKLHQKVVNAANRIRMEGRKVTIEEIMEMTHLTRKIVTRELQVDYTKVSYEMLQDD